jgi:hypothetical protein
MHREHQQESACQLAKAKQAETCRDGKKRLKAGTMWGGGWLIYPHAGTKFRTRTDAAAADRHEALTMIA